MKSFLESKQDIKKFLKNHATVYNLNECKGNKGLILYNNIEYGGRVPNFMIDAYDIAYFKDVLNVLGLLQPIRIRNVTFEYLNENVIEILIQWIQTRLNTSTIYKYSYWDFLNSEYVKKCFKSTSFKSLGRKTTSVTNIRNIFFGDCREHEVMLHVLFKLYLEHHRLTDEFKLYKYYGYGTTITQLLKNKSFWEKQEIKDNIKFNIDIQSGGSSSSSRRKSRCNDFPSINDISISTWEHTHPLLYIESSNKLITLDALGHKTYLNPDMVERHNVEIKIESKNVKNRTGEYTYTIWYDNLEDKLSRIYTESPTPFSLNEPFINTTTKTDEGMIFGYKFNLDKLKTSKNYNAKYKILNLSKMNKDQILTEAIEQLCLKK